MVILLVGSLPGRNSACGEALGLKWISVWNPMYVVVCSPGGLPLGFHMYTEKSVGSLPGRKSACGEPSAKRMTGLFYPRSASLGLSGRGLSGPQPSLPEAFPEHFPMFFFVNSPSLPEAFPKHSQNLPQPSPRLLDFFVFSFPKHAQAFPPQSIPKAFPKPPQGSQAFPERPSIDM